MSGSEIIARSVASAREGTHGVHASTVEHNTFTVDKNIIQYHERVVLSTHSLVKHCVLQFEICSNKKD